jgi:hypothetical protein
MSQCSKFRRDLKLLSSWRDKSVHKTAIIEHKISLSNEMSSPSVLQRTDKEASRRTKADRKALPLSAKISYLDPIQGQCDKTSTCYLNKKYTMPSRNTRSGQGGSTTDQSLESKHR